MFWVEWISDDWFQEPNNYYPKLNMLGFSYDEDNVSLILSELETNPEYLFKTIDK